MDGTPVSLEYRWVTLLQMVVPVLIFTIVFSLLMGLVFHRISAAVENPDVSSLAQLCAWVFFVGSFAGVTIGPLGVLGLASTLRRSGRK